MSMYNLKQREYPAVTVDVVVATRRDGRWQVLLVERKNPPFAGQWAIPGGFVEPHEPLEEAARRELWEETGAEPLRIEQLHAFGDPGRDPRGWTISIAHLAVLDAAAARKQKIHAGSDAAETGWFDLDDLPPRLAFDHTDILAYAQRRLADWEGEDLG